MKLEVKMKLNPMTEVTAEFEAPDLQDAIRAAGALLDFDGKCGLCDSDNITLQTRITKEKGYKYTEFVCRGCGAKRQMGLYKDGGGFFLKPWEEKYQGGDNNES